MNKLILSTLVITIATAPSLWAKNPDRQAPRWAEVIRVQPITRIVEQRLPQQECWTEQVPYRQRNNSSGSQAGTVIGTIIGGVIGHNISSHNRDAGTVIGAIIGGAVGHDISSQSSSRSSSRRCQVSPSSGYQEKILGYDVWYRYQGNEYKTQMDHHPGKRIRVRFSIEPY